MWDLAGKDGVMGKLNAMAIQKIVREGKLKLTAKGNRIPAMHLATDNLYLRVTGPGAASWLFRYQSKGKAVQIGLGSHAKLTLKDATDKAIDMKRAIDDGINPKTLLGEKHDPSANTFKFYAERYIEGREKKHKRGERKHKSAKHMAQWTATLERYVYPHIGNTPPKNVSYTDVEDIAEADDLASKDETKYRVVQRIKVILDEAADREHDFARFNPANRYIAKMNRGSREVQHHPYAMPGDVPAIYASLRQKVTTSALCLRWSILTACRSGETRGALWAEIDDDMWRIDGKRMKAGKSHEVWLGDEAQSILAIMRERAGQSERIFPGSQGGLISDVAINKTLALAVRDAGLDIKVTAHGFRSSFRTWGADETEAQFSPEALELCLAHTETNKVRKAYNHANMLIERKRIIKSWNDYCVGFYDNGLNIDK